MGRGLAFVAVAGLLHGALTVAAFPPWSLWPIAFLAIAPLAAAVRMLEGWRGRRGAAALLVLWAAVLPSWLWIERWTMEVSDAGWPVLSAYMSAWPVAFTWIAVRALRSMRALDRGEGGAGRSIGRCVVLATLWTGLECARAHLLLDGYPWYLLAHPLIDAPWLAQSAELWGVSVLSFLCAMSAAALVELLPASSGSPRAAGERGAGRGRFAAVLLILLAWASVAIGGAIRLESLPLQDGPLVVAIQANMPVNNKVERSMSERDADFAAAAALSVRAFEEITARGERPDLIAWPESVLPGFGLERDTILMQRSRNLWPADRYSSVLERFVDATGVPMLVGSGAAEGLRDDGGKYVWHRHYNSAYLIVGESPYRRYDKLQLTPFGETMPYFRAWKPLERFLSSLGARGFTFTLDWGSEETVFRLPAGTTFVSPICFEDTIPSLCRRLVMEGGTKTASLIVNLSNDGWFEANDAGRRAHLLAARWRAIELRVGVVRAANTGISAVIDPAGRVVQELPPRQEGFTTSRSTVSPVVTLYARTGEVGSWLFMITTLLLLGRSFLRRSSSSLTLASTLAIATLVAAPIACDSTPKGRRVTTATTPRETSAPAASPGVTGAGQHSWSTRDQSVMPDQTRAGDGEHGAKPVEPAIPVVSSGSPRQTAVDLLQTAAKSQNPLHVANAIEALENDPAALRQVIRPALVHPNRGVRFVAAMAVGRRHLEDMATLVQPLLMDSSQSVQAAAMYALTRLGRPVDLDPLAAMLRSDDPEVRGNAIMIFGDLQNPSAVPVLRASLGEGMPRADPARRRITDLQMAETLVKLGDDAEIEPLRAALFSHPEQAEMIALACQILGRLRDGGSAGALRILAYSEGGAMRPNEIRLLAFTALGNLGTSDQTAAIEFGRRFLTDPNPQLRALAVRELGACAGSSALPLLESRIYDSDATVQIAAAEAIVRLSK